MKFLALFVLAASMVATTFNEAQAFTQRETFVCKFSSLRLEIQSSLMTTGERFITADSSETGPMTQVDCKVAGLQFQSSGVGDTCLVSTNGKFMFSFYGQLDSTDSGFLRLVNPKRMDLCIRDQSASIM